MIRPTQPCRACGEPIRLVMVIPTHIRPGTERQYVPLDVAFDPETSPVEPSHALNLGRTRCRPITTDHPIEDHEVPALTHFATCPARQRIPASTAMEGTR